MNRRTVGTVCALLLGAVLAAAGHAQPSSGMMSGDAGPMGMTGDGSMMDMMMGRGPGMGMMGGSGTITCPFAAGGSMMGGGSMTGAGIGRLLQIPDLSGEQRQKLIDRDRQLQRQLLQLESKALDAQFALQDATRTDTPDPKAVGRALQNVYSVRTQMVEAAIAAANDARSMLTEEQRASLAQQRGMGMGGMGMGGMPGRMMPR